MGDYYNWYENRKDESSSLTVQFNKLMKVRQTIADEKVSDTIELIQNIIDQDKVMLTNWFKSLSYTEIIKFKYTTFIQNVSLPQYLIVILNQHRIVFDELMEKLK
jgi:tRNA G10  N-methylase Trm11